MSKIWIEQCEAARGIEDEYGAQQALEYLVGEKFINFIEAADAAMHSLNPDNFKIPPDVIKRHVKPNQFVELRIDSPRFSIQITSPPSLISSTNNTRK